LNGQYKHDDDDNAVFVVVDDDDEGGDDDDGDGEDGDNYLIWQGPENLKGISVWQENIYRHFYMYKGCFFSLGSPLKFKVSDYIVNFFCWDSQCNLTYRTFRGGPSEKKHPV